MTRIVRSFLIIEAAVFGGASLIHAGVLFRGYEHGKAEIAEAVIALVLFAGIAATLISPSSSRGFGLGAQGFALVGTLVGIFTILIGVGPRTTLDFVLHAVMMVLLVTGLIVVARTT